MGSKARFSFVGKLVAVVLLAGLADYLFCGTDGVGSTIGVFALGWALLMLVAVRAVRRRGQALVAAVVAVAIGGLLVAAPTLLGWGLFWVAVSSAALLARHRFDDALRWVQRLVVHIPLGVVQPMLDARALTRRRSAGIRIGVKGALSVFALPVFGSLLFLALFASANPIIAELFDRVEVPQAGSLLVHAVLWVVAAVSVWPSFRPNPQTTAMRIGAASLGSGLRVPAMSILISLVAFNLVFALQNALDIAFLWSGARLPGTVTMADYAHRGAYSLIVTALLAGLFVLVVLRPGSESARNPTIRMLVTLWVAQNLLLVASSILRTLDYVGSYSLTELRIWALGWMGLVGLGLVLICWRLLAGKSTAWLINANAAAATLLLIVAAGLPADAISAWWNVHHAREVGGQGVELDLCYLDRMGPAAALPLIDLERRVADQPLLLDRVRAVREHAMARLVLNQGDWHSWTWQNARRLEAAQALLGTNPARAKRTEFGRDCHGNANPPPYTEAPPVEAPAEPVPSNQADPAQDNLVEAARAGGEMAAAANAAAQTER